MIWESIGRRISKRTTIEDSFSQLSDEKMELRIGTILAKLLIRISTRLDLSFIFIQMVFTKEIHPKSLVALDSYADIRKYEGTSYSSDAKIKDLRNEISEIPMRDLHPKIKDWDPHEVSIREYPKGDPD